MSKKSPNIVVHFYRDSTERCKIVDKHLQILSKKHIEAKFCKVNAEKSPFLTQRLRIKVIPTIALIKDNKTKDYIVGFDDLGGRDDFSTEMMEWRIAQSGAIDYNVRISVKAFNVFVVFMFVFTHRAIFLLHPIRQRNKRICCSNRKRQFVAENTIQMIRILISMTDSEFLFQYSLINLEFSLHKLTQEIISTIFSSIR